MTRQTVPLGRIFGIKIELDYSWFLIFALMTWLLAKSYFPEEFQDWSPRRVLGHRGRDHHHALCQRAAPRAGPFAVALSYKIPVRRITLFIFGGRGADRGRSAERHGRVPHRHRRADRQPHPGLLLPARWKIPSGGFALCSGWSNIWRISTSLCSSSTSFPAFPWTAGASSGRSSGASPTTCAAPRSSPPMSGGSSGFFSSC